MAPRPTILACLWLAVAAALTAQDSSPSGPQQPTFRTGIQSVRVDLYATKDGQPVTDLRADEIELFEDGVPHAIQTFERISVAPHTNAAPDDRRSLAERRRLASDPRYRLFVVFVPLPARNPLPAAVLNRERLSLIQRFACSSAAGPR